MPPWSRHHAKQLALALSHFDDIKGYTDSEEWSSVMVVCAHTCTLMYSVRADVYSNMIKPVYLSVCLLVFLTSCIDFCLSV